MTSGQAGATLARGRRSARPAPLIAAARALQAHREPDGLAGVIAAGAAAVRPGALCTARLLEGRDLRLAAVAPAGRAEEGDLDAGLAPLVLGAAPLVIRDVSLDQRTRAHGALWQHRGFRSYHGLPLGDGGGPLGVLGLALPAGAAPLRPEERRALELYAGQASLALRVAVLTATVQRQGETLELARRELSEAVGVVALGQLVSGVVHDVNNLLGTVMLKLEVLRETPRDPETLQHLRALDGHFRQIGDLVGELRRFSAPPGAGRVGVDLTQLLDRILRLRQSRLLAGDIRLERAFAPGLPSVSGDPVRLSRALLAIVLDAEAALLAERHGGLMRASTASEMRDGRPWVVVRVEDDAAPVHPDALARAFEPIAPRAEHPGRRLSPALAAAHAIVAAHGGQLTLAGRLPRGLTYRLALPAATAP